MVKPLIVTLDTLSQVDPVRDCFIIKKVFDAEFCESISRFLIRFSAINPENHKVDGENWHYWVKTNGNSFDSFIFNSLDKLNERPLTDAYRKLFHIYTLLGESTHLKDFDKEIKIDDYHTDYRVINPLVFFYAVNSSNFNFHKHDSRNQKFQLLLNLTQPNIDYCNGKTWVYLEDGKPDPRDPSLVDKCCVFGDEFEAGDVFSFPYHRWHKVDKPTNAAASGINARISLLMPLGKRNSAEYPNEYL
jgi:hypothetical protein